MARKGRRQKKRTHVKVDETAPDAMKLPKSMVIATSAGEAGKSVSQLTRDMRLVMEPHTASRLRERKSNRLRDYTTMAGPLGVTHMLLFSQTERGATFRIARTPRGPTLYFRVEAYSLCKDLAKSLRNPKSPGIEFGTPPLLVLNNLNAAGGKENPQETLLTATFQNLFPAISAQKTALAGIRRVLLLHRDTNDPSASIELRHYAIGTKLVSQSRSLRKVVAGEKRKRHDDLPNLSSVDDISDFVLNGVGGGYDSGSEVEEDAEVEVKTEEGRKRTPGSQKRAVRLTELGPRLKLDFYKVTEGICSGKVLYHKNISKTAREEQEMEAKHKASVALKAKRKKEQAENVKRKRSEQEAKGGRKGGFAGGSASSFEKAVEDMSDGELSEEVFEN